jgi:hypothetical protein
MEPRTAQDAARYAGADEASGCCVLISTVTLLRHSLILLYQRVRHRILSVEGGAAHASQPFGGKPAQSARPASGAGLVWRLTRAIGRGASRPSTSSSSRGRGPVPSASVIWGASVTEHFRDRSTAGCGAAGIVIFCPGKLTKDPNPTHSNREAKFRTRSRASLLHGKNCSNRSIPRYRNPLPIRIGLYIFNRPCF